MKQDRTKEPQSYRLSSSSRHDESDDCGGGGGGDDDDGGGGGGQSRAGLLKGFLPLKEVSTRSSLHHHCFPSTLSLNHFVFCESFKGNLSSTCIITQSPLWEYLSNLSQFFIVAKKGQYIFFSFTL